MRNVYVSTASFSALLLLSSAAGAATLTVGPSGTYPAPCDAVAAAADNDVIEIDTAGTYEKDYCAIDKNGLTLKGVGAGRAKIDAKIEGAEALPAGNAIWVISASDVKIEKVELTGAIDAANKTASAIHQMGKGLTITDCSIHNNDAGLVADDAAGSAISVDKSEFFYNGIDQGDDPGHIFVGKIAKLSVTSSYLHHGLRVSMVKSSAEENDIFYNRISSEADGASRFSLDFPLGGLTYVVGNVFHRAVADEELRMVVYRQGQPPYNPSDQLFVVNNTFLSDKAAIGIDAALDPAIGDTLPVVRNNIFAIEGMAPAVTPVAALEANNFKGDPLFVDRANFDLRLKAGSPCEDKGDAPGMGAGVELTPKSQYMHVAMTEDRPIDDPIDIGAYEIPAPPPGTGGGGGAGGGTVSGGGGVDTGAGGSSSSSGTGGRPAPTEDTGCGVQPGDAGSSGGAAFVAFGIALLYGVRRRQRC